MAKPASTLIIFDMDGVLTQHYSSWQYVHDRIGVNNKAKYDLFKQRRLSYEEFLESDVRLWKEKKQDLSRYDIVDYLKDIPLRDNLSEAMSLLKKYRTTLAIVSAGISWLADRINGNFKFDYVYSNELDTDTSGRILPHGRAFVDPLDKGSIVRKLQDIVGVGVENTISVGDSVQDIPMFQNSAFSVSFNSSEQKAKNSASASLDSNDLLDLSRIIVENCHLRS